MTIDHENIEKYDIEPVPTTPPPMTLLVDRAGRVAQAAKVAWGVVLGLGLLGAFSALWMGIVEYNDATYTAAEQNATLLSGVILSVTVVIYTALMLVVLSAIRLFAEYVQERAKHHV